MTSRPYLRPVSLIGMALSLLGIADATYLTAAHYTTKLTLACPATKFVNCERVTTSSYSMIHGVPLALLGLIFFAVMLGLQLPFVWALDSKLIRNGRIILSIVGLISVFYLVFVELYRLDAICLYCTGVHILTFGLFVTTLIGTSIIPSQSHLVKTDKL